MSDKQTGVTRRGRAQSRPRESRGTGGERGVTGGDTEEEAVRRTCGKRYGPMAVWLGFHGVMKRRCMCDICDAI